VVPKGPRGDVVLRAVAAESGEPLAGAEVKAWGFHGEAEGMGEKVPAAAGDPPGILRLRNCPALPHEITVVAPGRAPGKVRVEVEAGKETRGPDVPLAKEARIRCRVLDAEGKPRPDVEVRVGTGIFGIDLASGTSDENGEVVLDGLPAGTVLVTLLRGKGDTAIFATVAEGQELPLVVGGPPRLEVILEDTGEEPDRDVVLVPLAPLIDILRAASGRGDDIPSGTRLLRGEEKGRLLVGDLPAGRWFVAREQPASFAVVEIPELPAATVRCVLRPSRCGVRVRRTGEGPDRSLKLAALPEGDAERALAGDAEALLRVYFLMQSAGSFSAGVAESGVELAAAGPGPQAVFAFRSDLAAASPVTAGSAGPAPLVELAPAALLTVRFPAGAEERKNQHFVAALDGAGRIAAVALQEGDVSLSLPPGRWRIEVRGPLGLRRSGSVVMPASGEEELVLE
jgi:hypothetical protein